jgi:ketosteroid isomerase-like protein
VDTLEAARRWAREWERAWREHDAERVAALYAPGASFRTSPFREPDDPGRYAGWAFGSEEPEPDVTFLEPALVQGDRAAVEWRAVSRDRDGTESTLAGISILRFGDDGLVVEERGYWNVKPPAT